MPKKRTDHGEGKQDRACGDARRFPGIALLRSKEAIEGLGAQVRNRGGSAHPPKLWAQEACSAPRGEQETGAPGDETLRDSALPSEGEKMEKASGETGKYRPQSPYGDRTGVSESHLGHGFHAYRLEEHQTLPLYDGGSLHKKSHWILHTHQSQHPAHHQCALLRHS